MVRVGIQLDGVIRKQESPRVADFLAFLKPSAMAWPLSYFRNKDPGRPSALQTVKRCSLDTCTHERLAGGGKANFIVYYHYDDEEGRRSSTS